MGKRSLFSIFLVIALILMVVNSTFASPSFYEDSSNDVFAYYTVESSSSFEPNEFILLHEGNDQYIESYNITFYFDEDTPEMRKNLRTNETNKLLISKDTKVIIDPKKYNTSTLLNKPLEFKIFPSEREYENMIEAIKKGHRFVPRSISTNVFFTKIEDGHEQFVNKSEVKTLSSSDSQTFTYLTASIYAYDEYRNNNNQKRHSFSAYHSRENPINSSPAFANTTKYDDNPDVLVLAWNVGGAIPLNDPSIYLQVAYNNAHADGNTYYETLYKDDSRVSKHDSLFTGNSIGYNIPDYVYRANFWPTVWGSVWHIAANSGWYNTGAYNGANGTVRTEFLHTYTKKSITVTPSISTPPGGISLSISGETVSNIDKSWVYTIVSPN